MTVCIAGISQGEALIALSDMMVSTDYFSADNMALKFRDLHSDWKVMFAGNDLTRVEPVLRRAKSKFRGSSQRSLTEVEDAMRDSFQEELVRKQTDLVLARYGLTMQAFLDTGLTRFGEAAFTTLKYQLDQEVLGCEFLVYGFDEKTRPHIFTVEDPGAVCNHDLYGFWAIGSGGNRALSSLFFQQYRQSLPEWKALYYIAEAKFMAEGGAVGEETLVMIKRKDGSGVGSLSPELLKKLWEKKGRPKIPNNAEEVVAECLKEDFFKISVATQSASQTSGGQQ